MLEVLPKPVSFGGPQPVTLGGSFFLERVLGTVPVEADGSANFELPAMRSLFFVALDENDMSVKRMQSFMTVQPGEVVGCVGCHEYRTEATRAVTRTMAMARAPSKIAPIPDVPSVFDFPRDIQPLLDKHCVPCHGCEQTDRGGPRAGGVTLTGDRGSTYSHSYTMLTLRRQFSDGRNGIGNRAPRTIGSSASPLLKKFDGLHEKSEIPINATAHEKKMVRLWIESAATYPGTYAALFSGMVSHSFLGNSEFQRVVKNRCTKCHTVGSNWYHILYAGFDAETDVSFSRPEKSYVLLRPLAPQAGGLGMMKKVTKDGKQVEEPVYVFKNTDDPDYQAMLGAIQANKKELDANKRFDMPGFRPDEHYIREMKVYGILPESFGPDDPIDPYKIDEKYWRSFWYAKP